MSLDNKVAEYITKTALDHYETILPKAKGKPQVGKEWTVYAAVVATRMYRNGDTSFVARCNRTNAWVVSCATGNKCTTVEAVMKNLPFSPCIYDKNIEGGNFNTHITKNIRCEGCAKQVRGMILRDSHAEVLARRGLMRVLWREIQCLLREKIEDTTGKTHLQTEHALLRCMCSEDSKITFELKTDVELHLYISDSPCGDASIYNLNPHNNVLSSFNPFNCSFSTVNFTGAKLIQSTISTSSKFGGNKIILKSTTKEKKIQILSNSESTITILREKKQLASMLRLKSGQSNIPLSNRSMSMSCSDKICKWAVIGLQGNGFITRFIKSPIWLKSIIISQDPLATQDTDSISTNHQYIALNRSIVVRVNNIIQSLYKNKNSSLSLKFHMNWKAPTIYIVKNLVFPHGKTTSRRKDSLHKYHVQIKIAKKGKTENSREKIIQQYKLKIIPKQSSPCGVSLNWQQQSCICQTSSINNIPKVEVTVGVRGLRQGKQPKTSGDILHSYSHLSSYAFLHHTLITDEIVSAYNRNMGQLPDPFQLDSLRYGISSYKQSKKYFVPKYHRMLWEFISVSMKHGPLVGWVSKIDERNCVLLH